jgi:uncharacterized protein (UPF0332 family)
MKAEELEYIRHRLLRSQEAIEEAELLLANDHFMGTVNRLYYACFYAVTALLYGDGLTSTTHNGVRTLFGEHWIKTNRLPKEMGTFYRKLFERRQKGDYTDTVAFGRAEVEAWLTETKAFVERINSWLNENVLEKT